MKSWWKSVLAALALLAGGWQTLWAGDIQDRIDSLRRSYDFPAAVRACQEMYRPGYAYKKAGVVVTRLMSAAGATGSLFADDAAAQRDARLSGAIDSINRSFGPGAIRFGVQGSGEVFSTRDHQSPHYTTRWEDIPKVKL